MLHDKNMKISSTTFNLFFTFSGDDHGGISVFENFKFKFMMNVVEHVKGLVVEKGNVYTLANMDLR